MKLRAILILLLALPAVSQTDRAGWVTIASAGPYSTSSPSVPLAGGTVYAFWGTTPAGVTAYCDAITVPAAGMTLLVWLPANCMVNGVPVPDIAPYGNHSLEIQQTAVEQDFLVTTPPMAAPVKVIVPSLPGSVPTTGFTCSGPVGSGTVIALSNFGFLAPTPAAPATNLQGTVKVGGVTLACSNLSPSPNGGDGVTCVVVNR